MSAPSQEPEFLLAVSAYARNNVQAWHTPGHKLGRGASGLLQEALGPALLCDLSDVLYHPSSNHSWDCVLQEAEARAAKLFGAASTRFLVNGTSGGIHAMLMAHLREGDTVIIPREAHLCVVGGLVLTGAMPYYLPMRLDEELGIPLPPRPTHYAAALNHSPGARAVLVTYPNYCGLCTDLESIAGIVKSYGAALLVDEAHGAHYAFHPNLPPPALVCGAQVTVQSAHKTLGALTQASMLHTSKDANVLAVEQALTYVGTTSPSSLLLASLDAARAQMAVEGEALWHETILLAERMRSALAHLPGVYCLGERKVRSLGYRWDPSRLVFGCDSMSGLQLGALLRRQFGIQVEMADLKYVIVLVGLGDTIVHGERLIAAVRALSTSSHPERKVAAITYPNVPPIRLSPRHASQLRHERVLWRHAIGRIASQIICPYPPGVPLIVPGEEITEEVMEYVVKAKTLGFHLRGDTGDGYVTVVA